MRVNLRSVLLWGFLAGNRLSRSAWYAMFTGFIGVGLLVLPRLMAPWTGSSEGIWLGVPLMLIAPLSYSAGSFLSSRLRLPPGILTTSAYQMLLGGVVLTGISAVLGELEGPVQASAASVWSLVYLIVSGSVLAFTAYAWLLRHVPVHQAATFAYVDPLIAVALGWLILAEPLSWTTHARRDPHPWCSHSRRNPAPQPGLDTTRTPARTVPPRLTQPTRFLVSSCTPGSRSHRRGKTLPPYCLEPVP